MPARNSASPRSDRQTGAELLGYLLTSGLALALDTGVYAAVLQLGCPVAVAATLGFVAGVSCAYACSVKIVFRVRRLQDPASEFAAFVAIGLAGLLLMQALLWFFVHELHLTPLMAKLATAGPVFLFNFGVRKALLFRAWRHRTLVPSPLEPIR